MGFLESLGKGFIRSAVNQVGRDTGKVVSNKIYGDAHATPIRNVGYRNGAYIDNSTDIPLTEQELMDRLKREGYKTQYFYTNFFLKIIYWFLGLFFTIMLFFMGGDKWALIPPCLLIFCAVLKFLASISTMPVYQKKEMATYKSDMRYKDGRRFTGFTTGKVEYNIKPTKRYKIIGAIISTVYIALAVLMYAKAYDVYQNDQSKQSATEAVEKTESINN